LVDEIQAYNKAKSSRQPSTTEDGTSRLKETIAELTAKQQLEASRVLSLLLELNDVKKELRDVSARANKITNIAK
jgi:hypothetical protein